MRIAVIVHGRFHAFDLVRELIKQGHHILLLTNYPKRICARFGIPPDCVRTNLVHGIASRICHKIEALFQFRIFEPELHSWFSRWSAKIVSSQQLDVIHGFSGVCEEFFLATAEGGALRTLVRGSAHIDEQFAILADEERRAGTHIDKPSDWMRSREKREYELADYIFVLSRYAYESFIDRGVAPEKLGILPLGAQLSRFRPDSNSAKRRYQRISGGEPLRVLTVGSFSLQKGALDYVEIARGVQSNCRFRFVGTVVNDAAQLRAKAAKTIEFVPRVPQNELPQHYEWADLFLYPTLQDGYAVVLAQALAAGLPIFATTNCAGPDLVVQGETGWVLPIRRSDLFIERLRWYDQHREELAAMAETVYDAYRMRDWSDVARDFVTECTLALEAANTRQDVARA